VWLHIPTSLSSPVSACSTSESTSLYQALAASATVSGKARQPRYWRAAWQKANWTKRLSTPTCDPSQSNRIVAAWLESLAGSRARISALPADKQESTANAAGSSLRSSDLFASWSPSSGSFWKTCAQSSLFPQELPYLENLPRSGSMRNGQLFERPTVARRTFVDEYSFLPAEKLTKTTERSNVSFAGTGLTPIAEDTDVPIATAKAWPTPASRDHKGANSKSHMDRSSGAKHLDQLPNFVEHCFHPDPPTPKPGQQSSQSGQTSRRRLNPAFVEWLMAVPLGWTDFAPLGTEWSRYKRQLRSAYSRIVREFSEERNEG
jgi:hypothetical protein